MRWKEFKLRFLSVRKCAACRKILKYDRAESALCESCELRINKIMLNNCPKCLKSARECICMPKILSRAGVLCHRKLFFYDSENTRSIENRIIYNFKRTRLQRLLRFFAERLAVGVREELEVLGASDVILTYVPRSKRSYVTYGFDQSGELVRLMSEILDIPYVRMFDTRMRAKTQKNLDAVARLKNAQKNIYAVEENAVKDKYVILVDDIVTTGASMKVCTELLISIGAKGVMCFSVASKNKM